MVFWIGTVLGVWQSHLSVYNQNEKYCDEYCDSWYLKIMWGILSGPPVPMWGEFSQKLSKNVPPKSRGCRIVIPNIPQRGVKCHFKVSNNEVAAKCSKAPSVSFKTLKNKPTEKPGVDVNHSKVRVKLHLWLHTLNCAWTLRWQGLTLSWKCSKGAELEAVSEPNSGIKLRTMHHTKGCAT